MLETQLNKKVCLSVQWPVGNSICTVNLSLTTLVYIDRVAQLLNLSYVQPELHTLSAQ